MLKTYLSIARMAIIPSNRPLRNKKVSTEKYPWKIKLENGCSIHCNEVILRRCSIKHSLIDYLVKTDKVDFWCLNSKKILMCEYDPYKWQASHSVKTIDYVGVCFGLYHTEYNSRVGSHRERPDNYGEFLYRIGVEFRITYKCLQQLLRLTLIFVQKIIAKSSQNNQSSQNW